MGSSSLSPGSHEISRLFRNESNANFTQLSFYFFPLRAGTSDWGDYDHDGDPDLLYNGMDTTRSNNYTLIYRNNGSGNFVPVNAALPLSGEPGSVQWGDVDNDGDQDILIGGPTLLLRNDGNDVFTDITQADFPFSCPNAMVDIDMDNDLDLFFNVPWGNGSTFFRNEGLNGISETETIPLQVFPNPCNGRIQISRLPHSEENMNYILSDSRGNVLQKGRFSPLNNQHSFNWTNLPEGLFVLQIQAADFTRTTKFVVVK